MRISIQNSSNTHKAAGQYLRNFQTSESMICNIKTKTKICTIDNKLHLPLTINKEEYANSYVCSIYTALIPYCTQELHKLNNPLLRTVINRLITFFDSILKKNQINKLIQINNWMLSTNLHYEELQNLNYKKFFFFLSQSFPEHSFMVRSLNSHQNSHLINSLKINDCLMIPTRQVYIFDKKLKDYSLSHNYKIDKKLLKTTGYNYVAQHEIKRSDYSRIIELYNMLYIKKYSEHNPQFTSQYIEMIINHPYFYIEGFRNHHGILDAVGGRFTIEKTTTLPIVGYDTNKPKKLGLYRLVLISTILYAEKNGLIFNASSGASSFKKLRGAVPFIEYAAVYSDHLSKKRKRIWSYLKFILDKVFIPIMRKYQL